MQAWFNKQSRLVQFLLLLIPVVNWLVELFVRGEKFFKEGGIVNLLMLIVAIFSFGILGWIDLVWTLLFNHLVLA